MQRHAKRTRAIRWRGISAGGRRVDNYSTERWTYLSQKKNKKTKRAKIGRTLRIPGLHWHGPDGALELVRDIYLINLCTDMSWSRTILHVDMDAFYASIEQRDRPELRGKPVIVGGSSRRGVVSAASYEARKYGVHSAMPGVRAHKLCPDGVFLKVDMAKYRAVSKQLMAILGRFTPFVEPLSVDEAFLDVTGSLKLFPNVAEDIRATIFEELTLTASVGVAPNKFLAKLASDMDKPDGLTRLPESEAEIRAFLAPIPIERMWGVGEKTAQKLRGFGIETFGDVQLREEASIRRIVGEKGAGKLWHLARGIDERPVVTERVEKSISTERTFEQDLTDPEEMRRMVVSIAEKTGRRLRAKGRVAGTVTLKLRFGDFQTLTRQRALVRPSHRDADIIAAAVALFAEVKLRSGVRLLGVGTSNFVVEGGQGGAASPRAEQLDLFEEREEPAAVDTRLDEAVDAIRERWGPDSVRRG